MYPVISIMFINIYIHVSILHTSNVYSYFVNSFMMVNLLYGENRVRVMVFNAIFNNIQLYRGGYYGENRKTLDNIKS